MRRPAPWAITFADLLTQCLCFVAVLPVLAAGESDRGDGRNGVEKNDAPAKIAVEKETETVIEIAAPGFEFPARAPSDAADVRRTMRIPLPAIFEAGSAALRAGHESRIEEAARIAAYDGTGTAEFLIRAEATGSGGADSGPERPVLALALERAAVAAAAVARSSGLSPSRFSLAGARGGDDGAVLVISFPAPAGEFGGAAENAERNGARAAAAPPRDRENPESRTDRE